MIPLRDHNPSSRIAFVNLTIIAVNLAVFVYQFFVMPQGPAHLINTFGAIPKELFSRTDIGAPTPVAAPLTLLSSMFIHAGWLHLFGNMLYLWIFGDNVEDRLGHGRYLIFYGVSGILAGVVHAFIFAESSIPCVGASGAVSGVLAAYLIFYPRAAVSTLFVVFFFIRIVRVPAVLMLGMWIVLQVASGLTELSDHTGGVAWFAHIGGFAAGLVLAFVLRPKR
jgi:membrane associated rhomboid family serine protease